MLGPDPNIEHPLGTQPEKTRTQKVKPNPNFRFRGFLRITYILFLDFFSLKLMILKKPETLEVNVPSL